MLSLLVLQLVHYHSGGLRLNPNLYGCGKVCLSLLGTWSGHGCEQWNPAQSTMLQVLVSIQALILNEMPYFNEPGFEASANTAHGQQRATDYNDSTFLLSCKTMLYSLRRPPEVNLLMQQIRNCCCFKPCWPTNFFLPVAPCSILQTLLLGTSGYTGTPSSRHANTTWRAMLLDQ
jgi:hypothetical protein